MEIYPVVDGSIPGNLEERAINRAAFFNYPEKGPWTVTVRLLPRKGPVKEVEVTKLPGRPPMLKSELDRLLEKEREGEFSRAA